MNVDLRLFLHAATLISGEDVTWLGGAMRLRVQAYLTTVLPPRYYTTSARAVVVTDAGCAVLRNVDGVHVLPGGRRKAEESIYDTLVREIREETGCSVAESHVLGCLHFHHLTLKPPDYEFPYPDFVHAVFAVRGVPDSPFTGDPEQYELAVAFVPPSELERFTIPVYQRQLVGAALSLLV